MKDFEKKIFEIESCKYHLIETQKVLHDAGAVIKSHLARQMLLREGIENESYFINKNEESVLEGKSYYQSKSTNLIDNSRFETVLSDVKMITLKFLFDVFTIARNNVLQRTLKQNNIEYFQKNETIHEEIKKLDSFSIEKTEKDKKTQLKTDLLFILFLKNQIYDFILFNGETDHRNQNLEGNSYPSTKNNQTINFQNLQISIKKELTVFKEHIIEIQSLSRCFHDNAIKLVTPLHQPGQDAD